MLACDAARNEKNRENDKEGVRLLLKLMQWQLSGTSPEKYRLRGRFLETPEGAQYRHLV